MLRAPFELSLEGGMLGFGYTDGSIRSITDPEDPRVNESYSSGVSFLVGSGIQLRVPLGEATALRADLDVTSRVDVAGFFVPGVQGRSRFLADPWSPVGLEVFVAGRVSDAPDLAAERFNGPGIDRKRRASAGLGVWWHLSDALDLMLRPVALYYPEAGVGAGPKSCPDG